MSSLDSPLIRTDDLDRGIERIAVLVSFGIAGALPWCAPGPATGAFGLIMLSCLGCGVMGAFWRFDGSLGGPRAVRSAVWLAQGQWLLEFADGRRAEARLAPATRLIGRWAALIWDTPEGRRAMLVGASRGPEFRHLAARLRLDGPIEPSAQLGRDGS